MVHTVDNNFVLDDNITKSVTHAELLDFSTNIYNVERYFNVGLIDEILKYTNISFAVLLNMKGGEQIYCCSENVMMHVLENCSDIIGFKYSKIFRRYSLNVIKKIIEIDPQKFFDYFNNYSVDIYNIDIYYANSEECHDKIIYVFEYCLSLINGENYKTGSSDYVICKLCWEIYLKAHYIRGLKVRWNEMYQCYIKQIDIDLIVKLQNLFKKNNMEEKIFNRIITNGDMYDIEFLKKTPYLKVIDSRDEPKPESSCLIM
mgnify:CR=1 FL=1